MWNEGCESTRYSGIAVGQVLSKVMRSVLSAYTKDDSKTRNKTERYKMLSGDCVGDSGVF